MKEGQSGTALTAKSNKGLVFILWKGARPEGSDLVNAFKAVYQRLVYHPTQIVMSSAMF